ncbi:GAF domain-containing SpoIIE family protein phosphatase [Actinomadura sp. HBU206391]|uniref:PP2C family protein-serine/threonine phosphatase n=1 Tax=Actinomadura sp. HBU206391 TaxID=2731692 RepID=UPI002905F02D|nr:GAF domain-containing SpoIIE family protein phosphatase [Actinomadura sp. HBU206391]
MIRPLVVASGADVPVLPAQVFDPARLTAVAATGLMDTGPVESLDDLAVLAASLTGARRAFITLVDARRSFWVSAVEVSDRVEGASEPAEAGAWENPVGDSPCHLLIGTGRELIVEDAAGDPRIAHLAAVRELGIGAWAGYPIHSVSGQVLGGLSVVDDRARPWTAEQTRGLATLARAVSNSIALRQALDQAHLRISELESATEVSAALARTLQDSLLPPVIACPPWLEAAAVYLPAAGDVKVVGDFFDLFPTRDQWWCAVLGDVCGHGLEAAKVTALARYTVRAEATQHPYPATVLTRLNHALVHQQISDRFLTAVCVAIRPSDNHGTQGARGLVSLGGHPPALLRRADGTVTPIGRPGLLLGVFDHVELSTQACDLGPGDALLLYTDGATEARNPAGDMLKEKGLIGLLADTTSLDAQQMLDQLTTTLIDYTDGRADDDMAMLILRIPGHQSARPAGGVDDGAVQPQAAGSAGQPGANAT